MIYQILCDSMSNEECFVEPQIHSSQISHCVKNWYQNVTFAKCKICVWSISIILGSKICAQRTSDSLNERLPTKMAREKFQRKRYFFHAKDSRFYPQIIHKSFFSHRTSTN